MTKKRFIAYLIDLLLLALILLLASNFYPKSVYEYELIDKLIDTNLLMSNKTIGMVEYLKQYGNITQQIDKLRIFYSIINIIFIFSYFILLPFYFNGSTIGKKILNIKVVDKTGLKVTMNGLIKRNIVINGLGLMIISIILLYVLPGYMYFITVSILGFVQILVVIISVFMIIYRRDKRGIHDIYSYTKVVENK